jgi:Ser/Thr protein kinase RdoA (MazF antagonist)
VTERRGGHALAGERSRHGSARPPDDAVPATSAWCARYLLRRGLVSPAEVVDLGVTVDDASTSHRAFRVAVGDRPRFFVKRADRIGTQGRDLSVETAVYRLAASNDQLARVLPRCHYLDEATGVVVLDAVAGDTLAAWLAPSAVPDPRAAALLAAYGRAMAAFHSAPAPPLGAPPWLLGALEPMWGDYGWLPAPCAAVLQRLAANPAMRRGFQRARQRWQPRVLVHGDLRWANVLVDGQPDDARLRIVDWELACLGDPSWDVGSALADVVALLALQLPGGATRAELAAWAAPLLAAYRRQLAPEPDEWLALLELSAWMAAIRLVQTIVEIGHVDPYQMSASEPILVAWSAGLLSDGRQVARELAGTLVGSA